MRPPPDTSPPSAPLLRNRNFLLLWAAYAISALGDHISEMAVLELQDAMGAVRRDTTRIQAVLTFAFMLPFFLLGPGMGWLADRLPRKWLMIAADLLRAAILFSVYPVMMRIFAAWGGWLPRTAFVHSATGQPIFDTWVYAAPLLLLGVFAAMFSPSRAAMLPTLVEPHQIMRANALTNALGPLCTIASYAIGGWLVAAYGVERNFQVDALTFLASAALLLWIRPPSRGAAASTARGSLLAGFRYVAAHHRVRKLILFGVVFWVAAASVRSVVPAMVKDVFGGAIDEVGYNQATLGIGILCGALALSALGDAMRPEIAVSWSLIGAGLAVLWLTVVTLGLGLGRIGGYAGLFVTGFFGAGVLVGINALLQRIVPNHYRGRVFGVSDFCSMAGLLLATGLLGLPNWPNIDRYVPLVLLAMAALLCGSGAVAVRTRLKRGRFTPVLNFWTNLNRIYCRFWHRVRREGPCTIPLEGPVIVAANHVSSLDPLLIIATSPNRFISYMIAREYYTLPVVGRLVRMIQCVPVNRTGVDTASVKAALRHLAEGRVLGIFPQGGIRPPDDDTPPREGVALLALRSGSTVIPAFVSGVRHSDRVTTPLLRRQRAVVRFGRPVDLSPWRGREKERDALHAAAAAIMAAIRALDPQAQGRASGAA